MTVLLIIGIWFGLSLLLSPFVARVLFGVRRESDNE
jgi:hypothetical protein